MMTKSEVYEIIFKLFSSIRKQIPVQFRYLRKNCDYSWQLGFKNLPSFTAEFGYLYNKLVICKDNNYLLIYVVTVDYLCQSIVILLP